MVLEDGVLGAVTPHTIEPRDTTNIVHFQLKCVISLTNLPGHVPVCYHILHDTSVDKTANSCKVSL